MRVPCALALILLGSVRAGAAEPQKPACALVKACGLAVEVPACGVAESKPLDGVVYDAQRCGEPRDLLAHGVTPVVGTGAFVYPFLGGRYRVVYDITGEAPISEARFDFLAQDLPLAAHLATRFSGTKYTMQYVGAGQIRFHAARADKLTGDAELLFVDPLENRRAYYGWGNSKFGPWKLHGSAYVDIRVRRSVKNPRGITYDVRVRTAPTNAMVNAIMRMGLFKGYVVGQIEDTMKDLVGAAAALSVEGLDRTLADPGFTQEERARIRTFASLPD